MSLQFIGRAEADLAGGTGPVGDGVAAAAGVAAPTAAGGGHRCH